MYLLIQRKTAFHLRQKKLHQLFEQGLNDLTTCPSLPGVLVVPRDKISEKNLNAIFDWRDSAIKFKFC